MNSQIENNLKSEQLNFINSILELDQPTIDTISHASSYQGSAQKIKYKTQKCRYWVVAKSCPFGNNCSFAHENWEMREKNTHQNYKTKDCHNFSKYGCCKYGDRCQFKHGEKKVVNQRKNSNSTFWDQLEELPNKIQVEFNVQPNQKRLKVFEEFSQDDFEKINWAYKKPRMYSM